MVQNPQDDRPVPVSEARKQGFKATPSEVHLTGRQWLTVVGCAAIVAGAIIFLFANPSNLNNYVLKTDDAAHYKTLDDKASGAVLTADKAAADLKLLNDAVAKVKSDLSTLTSQVNQYNIQIQQAVTNANTANSKVTDAATKAETATTNVASLTAQLNADAAKITTLQNQVTDLTAQLGAVKSDIQSLKSQPLGTGTTTTTSGTSTLNNVSAWVSSFGSAFGMGSSVPSFLVSTNSTGAGTGTFTLYVANSTNRTVQNLQISMGLLFYDATGVKQQDLLAGNTVAMGGVGSPIWVAQNPGATNMVVFTSGTSNSLFTWNFSQVPGTATYYTTLTVTGASANTSYTVYPQVKVVSFQ